MTDQPIEEIEQAEPVEAPKPKKSTKPKTLATLSPTERARAIVRARLK